MRTVAILLLVNVLLMPTWSFAETPEEQAAKVYKQGLDALAEGRDADAAAKFLEAFDIDPKAEYVCNGGNLALEAGRGAQAAEALSKCLQALSPEQEGLRATVERRLSNALKLAATLRVRTNIAGAEVIVGARVVGKTPLPGPVFLEPGRHVVEVRAPGWDPEARIVDIPVGEELDLPITLKPAELRAPALSRAQAPATPPSSKPPMRAEEARPRAAIVLLGLGMNVVGSAIGAGGLVAAAAAQRDSAVLTQAIKVSNSWPCTRPENGTPCWAADDTHSTAMGFMALGVGGIALVVTGGGLLGYEILRTGTEKNAPVQVAFAPAAGGGTLAIKRNW